MSTNIITNKLKRSGAVIPNETSIHLKQINQYGVRWADGTIEWDRTECTKGYPIWFSDIIPEADEDHQDAYSRNRWNELMMHRSKTAMMTIEDYMDTFRFLKRTVILSVTEAREV